MLLFSPLWSVSPRHEAKTGGSLALEEPSTYSSFLSRPSATAKREKGEGGRESRQGGWEGGIEGGDKEGYERK